MSLSKTERHFLVRLAHQFLGFGYVFAAGSMLYLVIDDVLSNVLEAGEDPLHPMRYLATGTVIGSVVFIPLILIL